MSRRATAARVAGGIIAGLALLFAVGVLVLTRTDWGRERIRVIAIDRLADQVAGRVSVDRIRGNLLSGATLENVNISDSAGAPFLVADTISLRYSLRSLLAEELFFSDVRLVRPLIVLDRPPGGRWNFERLFPTDTSARQDTTPGFGSWVRIEDMVIVDGRVIVRQPWEPPEGRAIPVGSGVASRTDATRAEVDGDRTRIVLADGGYQSVWEFRELDAELPFVRFADPDSATRRIDVASLSMLALPFEPPAARVRDLSGTFLIGEDTLRVVDARLELPSTRVVGQGLFAIDGSGALRVGGRVEEVALEDLRWLRPSLPAGGGEVGSAAIVRTDEVLHVDLAGIDLRVQGAHLAGGLDLQLGPTLRLGPSTLAFVDVSTALLESVAPSLAPPLPGTMNGHVRLLGSPTALDVAGRLAFTPTGGETSVVRAEGGIGSAPDGLLLRQLHVRLEPLHGALVAALEPSLPADGRITGVATLNGSTATGLDVDARLTHEVGSAPPSRISADGRIDLGDGVAARDLRLRFEPLQVALLRRALPDLPMNGIVTGRATVNGSPQYVRAVLDVEHHATTGDSRLVGTVAYEPAPSRFALDLRLPELALSTVGRFAPAAGLQGIASGRMSARGTPADFTVDGDLAANGGQVAVEGRLQLEGRAAYDLSGRAVAFDAAEVSTRAPATALTGTFAIRGRGTDPATATAIVRADMASAAIGGTRADSTHLLVRVADGLATAEHAHIRVASATADLEGSFGLVAGRAGELTYRIAVDSLSDFRRYVPADSGMVTARPLVHARMVARARADSIRMAEETAVQRMAVGYPPPPTLEVDSLPPIPRDSMAGTLRAEGVIAGNVERFDVRGTAVADQVVAGGSYVAAAEAEYALTDFGEPDASLQLDASADSLRLDGFAFDSLGLDVDYTGLRRTGTGTAELTVFQDPNRDYRLAAEFELALDRNLARLTDVALRFDTTHWSSTRTGVVEWGTRGVAVRTIELESDAGGRIFVDGLLPVEDAADLRVELDRLQIADVAGLLQDSVNVRGLLTLDARVTGTRASPRLEGDLHLAEATVRERELPLLDAELSYADQLLTGEAMLSADSIRLLTADARVPIDLALERPPGPRLLDRPLTASVHADSLPLDALPSFTEALADVSGRLRGDIAVSGTAREPDLSGAVDLDLASLRIVSPGIMLTDVAGTARLADDLATIDSLVANSDGGDIRVTGTLGFETIARPSFDLALRAENAIVVDSNRGRLRADVDLTAEGAYDDVLVRGDVHVRSGVIQAPETGKRRVTNLDDPAVLQGLSTADTPPELLPAPNPLLDNLRLEIGLRVARDTWVRNSDGNVEIYTPDDAEPVLIAWDRGAGTFALEGVINADRGEYSYAGHSFDLTTGSVSFLGTTPVDPLLQLTAQKEVRRSGRESLVIQIHVLGPLSEPRVALESNAQPPLPQSDLLAYLAFGRSSSSLLDLNASGAAADDDLGALGALAQQQLAGLGLGAALDQAFSDIEREGTRAGLDVFRIRPAPLPEELAFDSYFDNLVRGTELEAGKYFERRLFVATEFRPSSALPGVRVEYRHATGFTWEAVWEPHYLPHVPTLSADVMPTQTRTLGTFLRWSRRF